MFKGPSHMPIDFLEKTKFVFKSNNGHFWNEYTFDFEGDCRDTVAVSFVSIKLQSIFNKSCRKSIFNKSCRIFLFLLKRKPKSF